MLNPKIKTEKLTNIYNLTTEPCAENHRILIQKEKEKEDSIGHRIQFNMRAIPNKEIGKILNEKNKELDRTKPEVMETDKVSR